MKQDQTEPHTPLRPETGDPLPPDVLPELRQQSTPPPPNTGNPPPGLPGLQGPPPVIVQNEGSGCKSCLWGLGGAVGCIGLFVALVIGLIVVTGSTLADLVNNVTGLFEPQQRITGVFVPTVERIRPLSQLTTVRYNYANIVTGETEMPALLATLYGDSLVMVAVGHIEAGLRLEDMTAGDLAYDEASKVLTVRVPPPVLLNCFLNERETYVASRTTGVFASPSPVLDTASRRYALRQFRDMAMNDGIIDEAVMQSQTLLEGFLRTMMGPDSDDVTITFVVQPESEDAELPETCR